MLHQAIGFVCISYSAAAPRHPSLPRDNLRCCNRVPSHSNKDMMVTSPACETVAQQGENSSHLLDGAADTAPSVGDVPSASRLGAGCARVAGRCLVGVAAAMVPHEQQAALAANPSRCRKHPGRWYALQPPLAALSRAYPLAELCAVAAAGSRVRCVVSSLQPPGSEVAAGASCTSPLHRGRCGQLSQHKVQKQRQQHHVEEDNW